MLAMVKLHNLARNHRLQSLVAVRQLGKSVLLARNIACGPSCLSGGTQETSVGQHYAGIEVRVHLELLNQNWKFGMENGNWTQTPCVCVCVCVCVSVFVCEMP